MLDSVSSDSTLRNRSGRAMFDVSPTIGAITSEGEKTINISFTADHEGVFHDTLRIRFFQSDTDFATGKN